MLLSIGKNKNRHLRVARAKLLYQIHVPRQRDSHIIHTARNEFCIRNLREFPHPDMNSYEFPPAPAVIGRHRVIDDAENPLTNRLSMRIESIEREFTVYGNDVQSTQLECGGGGTTPPKLVAPPVSRQENP